MQHKRHLAELRTTRVEKEQLLQRVHDLETQLKASEGEVEDITMEVELLKSKLKEAQSTTGSVAATRLHVFLCMETFIPPYISFLLHVGFLLKARRFNCRDKSTP